MTKFCTELFANTKKKKSPILAAHPGECCWDMWHKVSGIVLTFHFVGAEVSEQGFHK